MGVTEAELTSLLDAALTANDRRLRKQMLIVGLTLDALAAELSSRAQEIATARIPSPDAAVEARENAVLELAEFNHRPYFRAPLRLTRRGRQRRKLLEGRVATAELELDQAREQNRLAARLASATGIVREFINKSQSGRFETTLSVIEHEGLAEMDDLRYAVPTVSRRRLDWLLDNLPGGSIGLAGPRGAGKSTLMRIACAEPAADARPPDGNKRPFSVMVGAPVQFEPRDFLLHLFSEVCQKVLGRGAVERMRQSSGPVDLGSPGGLSSLVIEAAPYVSLLAGVLLVLLNFAPHAWHVHSELVWGSALIAASLLWVLVLRERLTSISFEPISLRLSTPEEGFDVDVQQQARERLMDIWFQQSFTAGWSGTFKMPIGVDAGVARSRELAKQQLSLPDIVSQFRQLVKEIAKSRHVRIGIDELDKIESPEAAWQFMNEIKVLFLIPDCVFLISVSEDAMSTFQRRGLPFRDVFDSSFDDVVPVGYLDASGAIALVERRIVGLRVPFILLCHCMAGGLARDVIRAARDVVTLNSERSADLTLSGVTRLLVTDDINQKAEAALVACRRVSAARGVDALLTWLHTATRTDWSADMLLEWLQEAPRQLRPLLLAEALGRGRTADVSAAADIAREFASYCLFAATLLQYFVSERLADEFQLAVTPGVGPEIDTLVRARQDFVIDARLAWVGITQFRSACGVESPRFPQLFSVRFLRGSEPLPPREA